MSMVTQYMRLIAAMITLCGAAIYIAMNFIIFDHARTIAGEYDAIQNPKDPLAGGSIEIVNTREPNSRRFRPGYREMAQHADINARRYITFSASVPMRDLLRPGESPPSKEMEGVFAQTRALFYAREECDRIVKVLAQQCEVETARGKPRNGLISITGTMRFVQSAPFGEINPDTVWSYEVIRTGLVDRNITTSLSRAETARMELYRKAAKECKAIKAREGSCAITRLSVRSQQRGQQGDIRLSGEAQYSFLAQARG